jgi:hypothetical protein
MALSADKRRRTRNLGGMKTATVLLADSQTVYEGAIIMRNAAGDPVVGADVASSAAMGVATEAVTSGPSNTTKFVKIEYGHEEWFKSSGVFTKTSIGTNVCILDDETIATAAVANADIPIGILVQLETIDGVLGGWVRICEFV